MNASVNASNGMKNSTETYRLINEVFLIGDDLDRQILATFSLTVRQYHLLNWLAVRGQASMTELAQLLLCDKSNVTGIVRRLKTAHLILDVPRTDRRFTTVKLTSVGVEIHQKAEAALTASIHNRYHQITEPQHRDIHTLLACLHQVLTDYRDQHPVSEISGAAVTD